ncbi:leucine-rich repeat-containing protein 74B-like [Parasteatoda tepidariorum]|uniref:leucine-rich repeat-containing protein 74B-like n=1 Tax=Parasteatoda tepidariorum TaxID=114398 RepID=UPI0039BC3FA8
MDENVEIQSSEETEINESVQKEKSTTNETNSEEFFKTKLNSILERIRNLDTVEDLKLTTTKKEPAAVYSELCKIYKIVESSTFLSNINNEEMDFSYHGFELDEIISVTKALVYCKSVKRLNLSFNNIGPESLSEITSLLNQNEHIMHLNLSNNGIGKKTGESLSNLLSESHSVTFLDLSGNNLGDEEFAAIGNALPLTNTIKTLNLSRNDIGMISGALFGTCIAKCSSLEELDLSSNHIEDGLIGVFNNMKKSNLRILTVSRNGIPDAAMDALARGLRACKTLQEVDVSSNFISNKGAMALAPGLKGSTVEIFRIAHNPFQGKPATVLLRAAGANLKLLDLSGIKVDLSFLKFYRSYSESGRDMKVLFGSEIRYDIHPRDQFQPEEGIVDGSNALLVALKFADEKGMSLKNVLRKIHSSYLKETPEEEETKEKEEDEVKERRMTATVLANGLIDSDLEMPKTLAREISTSLADEEGFVDMWEIITKLPYRPDDIAVQIKKEKKKSGDKKSKDKKSKKGKGKK